MGTARQDKAGRQNREIGSVESLLVTAAGSETAATLMRLFFHQTYGVPIRVADHESFFEAELSLCVLRNRHHLRGDKLRSGVAQSVARCADVFADDARLPMPEIVRFGVGGHRPAARGRLVIQEL